MSVIDNHFYDLMKAITKKAYSVWKYNKYLEDSESCPECQALWKKLKDEESTQLEEMKQVLISHIKAGGM